MKRFSIFTLAMVLALSLTALIAGIALAQGPDGDRDGVRDLDGPGQGLGRGHAYGFVDENGDGVNDRFVPPTRGFVDADGDGQCDNAGLGLGLGRNAQGAGMGRQGSGMRGANFIDENGDGVCDWLQK